MLHTGGMLLSGKLGHTLVSRMLVSSASLWGSIGEMLLSVSKVRAPCCLLGNGRGSVRGASRGCDDLASGLRGVSVGSAMQVPCAFMKAIAANTGAHSLLIGLNVQQSAKAKLGLAANAATMG